MICLCLTGRNLAENLELLAAERGRCDLAELRADFLDAPDAEELREFPRRAGLPLILTIRMEADGGQWSGSREVRDRLLEEALSEEYAWVDLEAGSGTESIARRARELGVGIIRSLHDFTGVPDDLPGLVRRLPEASDEIPRLAVMPRCTADLRRILSAMKETDGRRIILGMGEWGLASRILSQRYGCWLTYASAQGRSAAPGHLDPATLAELYRYRSLGPATRIYAVIGNPVMHSRSPQLHNPGYLRDGLDACYLPVQVDSLADWFSLAGEIPVGGFSVTVPHKQAVIEYLDSVSPAVEAVGACNTVVAADGGWRGENTDVEGFLKPLIQTGGDLAGSRVTVIGAGGAARAVVYGLKRAEAEVLILNRSEGSARGLAERFDCEWGLLGPAGFTRAAEYADIIVQTTPAGMHPDVEANPFAGFPWRGTEIAYDLVYSPQTTRFLQAAREAGAAILNGEAMLAEQGRIQYRIFTGRDYPDR